MSSENLPGVVCSLRKDVTKMATKEPNTARLWLFQGQLKLIKIKKIKVVGNSRQNASLPARATSH